MARLPKEKLYVTIFKGEEGVPRDEEAYELWREHVPPSESMMGMKDNFWAMGDTGPCGPCSEIFYDMGLEASETGKTSPSPRTKPVRGDLEPGLHAVRADAQGELHLLPKPSIDTGAGLERLAAVLQGKVSNLKPICLCR